MGAAPGKVVKHIEVKKKTILPSHVRLILTSAFCGFDEIKF